MPTQVRAGVQRFREGAGRLQGRVDGLAPVQREVPAVRLGQQQFVHEGLFTLFLTVRSRLKQRQSRRATTPRLAAWARSVTTSGAVLTTFPPGCGQKGHAPRCEA